MLILILKNEKNESKFVNINDYCQFHLDWGRFLTPYFEPRVLKIMIKLNLMIKNRTL
jgi:hypothetical protein